MLHTEPSIYQSVHYDQQLNRRVQEISAVGVCDLIKMTTQKYGKSHRRGYFGSLLRFGAIGLFISQHDHEFSTLTEHTIKEPNHVFFVLKLLGFRKITVQIKPDAINASNCHPMPASPEPPEPPDRYIDHQAYQCFCIQID